MAIHRHATAEDSGRAYVAPLDVHLPTGSVVQPDVLFIRQERLDIVVGHVQGAPDLVVEVVSPFGEAYDRITKRGLYARGGVPAYWIADPAERSIETLALEGGAYRPEGYFEGDAVLTTPILPDFHLPLPDVFR